MKEIAKISSPAFKDYLLVLSLPQVDDTTSLLPSCRETSLVGMGVLHDPDEVGDFGVTHNNKGFFASSTGRRTLPHQRAWPKNSSCVVPSKYWDSSELPMNGLKSLCHLSSDVLFWF